MTKLAKMDFSLDIDDLKHIEEQFDCKLNMRKIKNDAEYILTKYNDALLSDWDQVLYDVLESRGYVK